MKTRKLKIENAVRLSSSVLDCDGPPPLATSDEPSFVLPSASGLAQSKTWRTLAAAFTFAILSAFTAHAQTFAIDRFVLSGGGGTSTNGAFNLTGTIGQPDAGGPMTGGSYLLTGGFWALPFAVQTPGAPTLTIAPFSSGQARISWTPNTPGFVLQENTNLNTTNWVNSPSGAGNPVTVPATLPIKSYRLRKP